MATNQKHTVVCDERNKQKFHCVNPISRCSNVF